MNRIFSYYLPLTVTRSEKPKHDYRIRRETFCR